MSKILRKLFSTKQGLSEQDRLNLGFSTDPHSRTATIDIVRDQDTGKKTANLEFESRENLELRYITQNNLEKLDTIGFDKIQERRNTAWGRFVSSPFGRNIQHNLYQELLDSNSPTANLITSTVLEDPSGLGTLGNTASTLEEAYKLRILSPIARISDFKGILGNYARINNQQHNILGFKTGVSKQGVKSFSRDLMLELNQRIHSRETKNYISELEKNPDNVDLQKAALVQRAADLWQEGMDQALMIAQGKYSLADKPNNPITGMMNVPRQLGYFPKRMSGIRIQALIQKGITTKSEIVLSLTKALYNSDIFRHRFRKIFEDKNKDKKDFLKFSNILANNMISRALNSTDSKPNLDDLSYNDSIELIQTLRKADIIEPDQVQELSESLKLSFTEQGMLGQAKTWLGADYSTPIRSQEGQDLRLVDILEQDMFKVADLYARQIAGNSALARVGIPNAHIQEQWVRAIQREQRILGEIPINSDKIRAMFSHFKGTPVHGMLGNRVNEGIGETTALVKKLTNLAFLNKVGFAQAAETPAVIAKIGLRETFKQGCRCR